MKSTPYGLVLFTVLTCLICIVTVSPSSEAARAGAVIGFADKCLDVRGHSDGNGTPVQIWDCVGVNGQVANQQWTLTDRGELRGLGNKCLDVRGPSSSNGTPVQIWDCVGVSNQRWTLDRRGQLRGYAGKCLDVRGPSSNNGTPVQMWDCVGVSNQQWRIGKPSDNDKDGMADAYENALLKIFAPRIWLHSDEVHLPVNAGWFITRSALRFSHNNCPDHEVIAKFSVTPQNLITQVHNGNKSFCRHDGNNAWFSDRSKSDSRQTGFFMDLENDFRGGTDTREHWLLYGHVFPVANNNIAIQYWQLYAYNKADTPEVWNINHEGDWEYTAIRINRAREVQRVTFYRHGNAREVAPDQVEWIGNHHVTYSSRGSHAQYRARRGTGCQHDTIAELHQTRFDACNRGIRWDSWSSRFGGIVNVGEKDWPTDNEEWLQYSGLWGEVGAAAQVGVEFTSGPHGPAYQDALWNRQ